MTTITSSTRGLKQVAWLDCPGGGQVSVDGTIAYVAHMKAPHGTSIVDVSDPARPRTLATVEVPPQTHSHKVRAANGLMLVNREAQPAHQPPAGVGGGLVIYDVSDPSRPREITFWKCGGAGVHRFTFDGRYAYISPEMDGYVGNIVMILDLQDPARPREVGRWWMPGQWTGGGETPAWSGRHHRCHHPIRSGNRLYVSYWHGGFVILDIEDMGKPRFVSGLDWSPPYITPTHTALPLPFPLHGRRIMLAADEDVATTAPGPPARWPTSCRSRRRAIRGSRATTWRWTGAACSTSSTGAEVCTSWSGFSRHSGRFTDAPQRCLRSMNNRTDHGFLVLADVSGFTAFVTTTELEHGSDIIATLLDEVIGHLSPPLEIQEIEGDAVFALAGADFELPHTRLLAVLEEAFAAFKSRQQAMQAAEECQCGACQRS